MYASLLENFFGNECSPRVLEEIRAILEAEEPPLRRSLGGNVYTAEIDFENGVVLIEDDLDISETGTQRLSIDEFRSALIEWQRNGNWGPDPQYVQPAQWWHRWLIRLWRSLGA
jgi:hypothetical protein